MKTLRTTSLLFMGLVVSVGLIACGDDKSDVDTSPITVLCGKTVDLSNRGSGFTSSNDFVASVSSTTLNANHIGQTTISDGENKIAITVTPTVVYMDHPCINWGASIAEVQSEQKVGEKINSTQDDRLSYKVETSSGKIKYLYMYLFKEGKLSSSCIMVPTSDTDILVNWLSERYIMGSYTSSSSSSSDILAIGLDGYTLNEATTICSIMLYTKSTTSLYSGYNYFVMFTPAETDSQESTNRFMMSDMIDNVLFQEN